MTDPLATESLRLTVDEVEVELKKQSAEGCDPYVPFAVCLLGSGLCDPLWYNTETKRWVLPIGPGFREEVGGRFVFSDSPVAALQKLIAQPRFADYMKQLISFGSSSSIGQRPLHYEFFRFRDVLVRKYRQLSFVNEYGCVEIERFLKEAKRFVKSRHLYDHFLWDPKDQIEDDAEEIVMLTSAWASVEEDNARSRFNSSMSSRQYEQYCADRFAEHGWNVRLTKASGDQGVDIVCEARGRRLVVQCKLYSGAVGNAAVQEAIAAREFEGADLAAVVSNGVYTSAARELASAADVCLLHHDEIEKLKP